MTKTLLWTLGIMKEEEEEEEVLHKPHAAPA
jgi:hypothetical protein